MKKFTGQQIFDMYAKYMQIHYPHMTNCFVTWEEATEGSREVFVGMAADINAAIAAADRGHNAPAATDDELWRELLKRNVPMGSITLQQGIAAAQNAGANQQFAAQASQQAGTLAAYQQRAAMQMQAAPPETKRSAEPALSPEDSMKRIGKCLDDAFEPARCPCGFGNARASGLCGYCEGQR